LGVLSIGQNANAIAIRARINKTSGRLLIKLAGLGADRLRRRLPAMSQHRVARRGASTNAGIHVAGMLHGNAGCQLESLGMFGVLSQPHETNIRQLA
jgi:hypothetical protein